MNEGTMKELLLSNQENFKKVFAILDNLVSGFHNLEARVAALESKDVITKPLWQEMRAAQQRTLDILQEHSTRIDRIEAHLQQQGERMDRIEAHLQQQDEKIEIGFRKLGDKFDHLALDYYDLHADVVDLKRRVTRLEPVN